MNMIEKLIDIIDKNKDKRICILGTTCTGKSTLINNYNIGQDMDELIFPLLTKEETDYVCSTPWTEDIGNTMDRLVRERLKIIPGEPLLGTVLLDCDLIIYLHISDSLLEERTKLRGADYKGAKGMQEKIEEEINNSNILCITIEVENINLKVK